MNRYALKASKVMYDYGGGIVSLLWSGGVSMVISILLSYFLMLYRMPLWLCLSSILLFPLGVGTGACIGNFVTRSTTGDRTKIMVILSITYLLLFITVGMVWVAVFRVFPWKVACTLMIVSAIFCSLSKKLYPIYRTELKMENKSDDPLGPSK